MSNSDAFYELVAYFLCLPDEDEETEAGRDEFFDDNQDQKLPIMAQNSRYVQDALAPSAPQLG